jgi:hypothetical protein
VALLVAVILASAISPGLAQDRWAAADQATVRLAPAAFPALPPTIRTALEERGCTVPQVYDNPRPHNVVRGSLRSAGSVDWAVLCSINQASRVLVFWSGHPDSIEALGETRDVDFLQGVGGDSIGFSHEIRIVSRAELRRRLAAHREHSPVPVTHDGLEDAFVGKASGIGYYYRGRWYSFPGAD